jgi:hypothetical protein
MNPTIRLPVDTTQLSQPIEVSNQRPPVQTGFIGHKKEHSEHKKEHDKMATKEQTPKEVHQKDKNIKDTEYKSCINMPFYGSTIVQDSNPLWIKVDGIILGDSDQFSYKEIPCTEIWNVLPKMIDDLKVTVINYNQEKGVAFLKTGFDVHIKDDVKKNKNYTSFVLKSKIVGNPFN